VLHTSAPRRTLHSPLRYVDWTLPLVAVAVSVLGVFMNYSATWRLLEFNGGDVLFFARRQAIFVVIGVGVMVLTALLDYRVLGEFHRQIYLGLLISLAAVLVFGREVQGARAWFQLPGFQLQPAELGKFALIVALAAYASRSEGEMDLPALFNSLMLAAVPMVLIFLENDIGTMLIYAAIVMGMLLVAGARVSHIVVLTIIGALVVLLVFNSSRLVGRDLLGERQQERLTAFLDQSSNQGQANYNLNQSQIALGSGGLTGQGWLKGTQTNLNLVPEQETDFIFTAVGEELGFLFGSLPLLLAYLFLMSRMLAAARLAGELFGTLVVVGVLSMFLFQTFENLGMTMGIMPITGIPLPFMSHGGSSIITAFAAVGLVVNVRSRRFARD